MALKQNFYEEIYDKEKMWLANLEYNLLNTYYLPEIRAFYVERLKQLNYQFELTGNHIIRSISIVLNNMIKKIDYFINEDKKGNLVNLKELSDYFLINVLNNDLSYMVNKNINKIEGKKKNLYELRKKVINDGSEDYLDDDFYYNMSKAA